MLFVFLPGSSNAIPEDASRSRIECTTCGSVELDIKVEIESVETDLGRKKRGRLSTRGIWSPRGVGGLHEEISGTEPRRGTVMFPGNGSRGGKPLGRR